MTIHHSYPLHLADNALILGHRNSEWTGHGPILEQDIALSNISLDLIGQARNFYQYAASLKNDGSTEDDLAYLRDPHQFLNCLIVEQENGHWGKTVMRQFLFSAYASLLYAHLSACSDKQISAIAAKSNKEVTYHLRWSSEWVIRLGQGTSESNSKMQDASDELWPFTEEMYTPAPYEQDFLPGADINAQWNNYVKSVFSKAGIIIEENTTMKFGGKTGEHTHHLGNLLTEMQYMQRTYPGVQW